MEEIAMDHYRSFILMFTNLQELVVSCDSYRAFEDLDKLQYVIFPQLRILKFPYGSPKAEVLFKFLEINGRNLRESLFAHCDNSLSLAIAKFCPNLKSIFTLFNEDEIEALKVILTSCQQLESIKTWCEGGFLNGSELLKVLIRYSLMN